MNIDAAQYQNIARTAFQMSGGTGTELSASDAELIVAIAQLAMAADRELGGEEAKLFDTLAGHVYTHANIATSPPSYAPLDDDEQRLDHMRNHAAQLAGKPSAALAYSVAYILSIVDLAFAPEEGDFIEALREALALDTEKSDELVSAVSEIVTPAE